MTAEALKTAALSLSVRDRAELAAALLATLQGEAEEDVEAAWEAEVERRWGEVERGDVVGLSWEQVRARGRRAA